MRTWPWASQGQVWGHRRQALPGGRSNKGLCGLDVLPQVQAPTRTHLLFSSALGSRAVRAQACHRQLGCVLVPQPCTRREQEAPKQGQLPDTPLGNSDLQTPWEAGAAQALHWGIEDRGGLQSPPESSGFQKGLSGDDTHTLSWPKGSGEELPGVSPTKDHPGWARHVATVWTLLRVPPAWRRCGKLCQGRVGLSTAADSSSE